MTLTYQQILVLKVKLKLNETGDLEWSVNEDAIDDIIA